MATNYEYDDEDDETTQDGGINQLRKVNRALEKRAKDCEKERCGVRYCLNPITTFLKVKCQIRGERSEKYQKIYRIICRVPNA
jgi:hypothetical protein